MAQLVAGSLFTGIGGFDLGLQHAGIHTTWQAEKSRFLKPLLKQRFPDVDNYGDIRGLHDLPPVDIITGGFPCTNISNARWAKGIGRGRGLAGDSSKLWFEYHRIVATLRPTWIIVENVPALLSTNHGRDMCQVASGLADIGYGIAWRVVDSRSFGVPQRRRRLFIVGHLGNERRARQVLLDAQGCPQRPTPSEGQGAHVGALTANGIGTSGADDTQAQAGHLIADRGHVRRLTPIECERLQGFPDRWTEPLSDYQRYRALGNAVTVPIATWLARRITATT